MKQKSAFIASVLTQVASKSSAIHTARHSVILQKTLAQTGRILARTNLSPFAWCTLGLNRNFY